MGDLQWWHVAVMLVVLGLVVLFVAAIISIARSPHLEPLGRLIWIVVCLFLQFFGPVAWFVWGRHQRSRPAPGQGY